MVLSIQTFAQYLVEAPFWFNTAMSFWERFNKFFTPGFGDPLPFLLADPLQNMSLFERRFPILITSWLDCMFSCSWMLDSGKTITLFVFAKIEIYCNVSQNTDRIALLVLLIVKRRATSQQMVMQPSLSS